jgi:hypothetical protein
VNNVQRANLAALDALTGDVLPWRASTGGSATNTDVHVLAADDRTIYAGGQFLQAGGVARVRLAAFDAIAGDVTAWDPHPDTFQIDSLDVLEDRVIVGGFFRNIGGAARNYLASVDKDSGAALPWNPNPDNAVTAITSVGNKVYVAGTFKNVGGIARDGLAIIDGASGAPLPESPALGPGAYRLAVHENRLIAGGSFAGAGGRSRTGLAAFDASTGALDPWAPQLKASGGPRVRTVVVTESAVWAAGSFSGARSGHVFVDQQNLVAYPIK